MSISPLPLSPPTLPPTMAPHPSDLEGHIQVIFGPMFSGKTTELMRRVRRYTHANKRCQVIKYAKDLRYEAGAQRASTHDRQQCDAVACSQLSELTPALLDDVDVIGIDEGQFFVDCVSFADHWASRGKVVIVAALDGTFERKPFGHILELVAMSESVVKLNAVCMLCHRDASFTKRIGSETAVEVIGGADKYLSTCRACFTLKAHSPSTADAERAALRRGVSGDACAKSAANSSTASSPALPLRDSCPALLPLSSAVDEDDLLLDADGDAASSSVLASNKRVSSSSGSSQQDSASSDEAPHSDGKPSLKRKPTQSVADLASAKKQQLGSQRGDNKENVALDVVSA